MRIIRRIVIGWVVGVLAGQGMAAEKAYTNMTYADFNGGMNGGTRITADGRVRLDVNALAVVPASTQNWGLVVSPVAEDPNCLWVEAEDVMEPNASFMLSRANCWGLSTDRWSGGYGMVFGHYGPNPPAATSTVFNIDLPWTGVPYYVHVRTDNQSWNSLPSTIDLYTNGVLAATGATTAGWGLAWHTLSAPISGGSNTLHIVVTPNPGQHSYELESVDTLLFTTDANYTPTNPVDTNGKIVGATVLASGSYTSAVIDTGADTLSWHQIQWDEEHPGGTELTLQTRTGTSSVPGTAWSDWSPLPCTLNTGEAILSPVNRYIQYRANFTTDFTATRSPLMDDVVIKADTTITSYEGIGKYGVYGLAYDQTSIPGYTYLLNSTNLAFYDFSLVQANCDYRSYPNFMPGTLALNPNHRFIVVLSGWQAASVLDCYYKPASKTAQYAMWAAQIEAAQASGNAYAVTFFEEEPQHVWAGFFPDTAPIPAWITPEYQTNYMNETTNTSFDWPGRFSNDILPWLREKTKTGYNDAYDWIKANYPGVKVFHFMFTPGSGAAWGLINLGPDLSGAHGYKADGWVVQYGLTYDQTCNWIADLRQAGIPNDEIYMQLWAFDSRYDPGDVVWQTLQARSMGIENVFTFYVGAWIPPSTDQCDYLSYDHADGSVDGVIGGQEFLCSLGKRVEWEDTIANYMRQLSVTLTPSSAAILLGDSVTLSANASAGSGSIGHVRFYQGGILLADVVSPYSTTWTPSAPGIYTLTAKAYDAYENAVVSTPVIVTVNDVPVPTLTAPVNGAAYLLPASITWTATVANTIGGITNVSFYTNGAFCATGRVVSATVFTNVWKPSAGRYTLSVKGWDNYGANGASFTNTILAWTNQDIGAVVKTGSGAYTNGTYTVAGGGADIWGNVDAFRFVYVPLTGSNCTLVARVAAMSNPNTWAKAGVMIRKSLAANAVNAFVAVTPTTANGVTWQYRASDGGVSTLNANTAGITPPRWVKLVRNGNSFTAYQSTTNTSWTAIGTAVTLANMGTNAYVGLALTSHTTSILCTSTFDNVSITMP